MIRATSIQPAEAVELNESFLTTILQSLVAIPSVNPGIYEAAMAERVAQWLEPTACAASIVEFAPGRSSVGAVLDGKRGGTALVLNGHMDTVPIDDPDLWSVDPYGGVVKNGYLYGRGACDMKAGLTVQIAIAHWLSNHTDRLQGSLVLHFAAGEECGEPGTLSLIESGYSGDLGITTEPTSLRVATAVRGAAFYTIRINGRSIHASRSHLGLNPLLKVGAVLAVVEEYDRDVRRRPHPLLPGGSCTPTMARAGVKANAVADFCDLTLDRRFIPGESVEVEMAELSGRLDRLRASDPDFSYELTVAPYAFEAAEIPADSPFAARVAGVAADVIGEPVEIYGTPFGSDVRNLINDAGIEAVTFGAGNVEECHCPDERVSLAELRQAAIVTATVAAEVLLEADAA